MNLHEITPAAPENIRLLALAWQQDWGRQDRTAAIRYHTSTMTIEYRVTDQDRWRNFESSIQNWIDSMGDPNETLRPESLEILP